jgi:hypothetical protein
MSEGAGNNLLNRWQQFNMERLNSVQENYSGRHREFYYLEGRPEGIGLIPHGDRDRCKDEFGVDAVEDRDSDPNIRRI